MAASMLPRPLLLTALLSFFAAGLYHMRIHPMRTGIPIDFEASVAKGQLTLPSGNTLQIRETYTGVKGVDEALKFFVAAFISGPARVEERIWLQQLHFLLGFAPFVGILTVESCRVRWRGTKGIRWTSLWATFYQTVGGAVVLPLYPVYFILRSEPVTTMVAKKADLARGQGIDRASALALIPSVLLGYIVPTMLLFALPQLDLYSMMGLVAYWQVTPFIVNIMFAVLSTIFSTFTKSNVQARSGLGLLHTYYAILVVAAASAHTYVLTAVFQSPSPWKAFHSIFVPDFSDVASSTSAGLHNIFQWDWILITASLLVLVLYAVTELKSAGATDINLVTTTVLLTLGVGLIGPGGAAACFWWWREVLLVRLENQGLKLE